MTLISPNWMLRAQCDRVRVKININFVNQQTDLLVNWKEMSNFCFLPPPPPRNQQSVMNELFLISRLKIVAQKGTQMAEIP